MTTFLTTILVALLVALALALLWLVWLKMFRLTIELAVEVVVNLSQAFFSNRQMSQDLEHNRNRNKLELSQAKAACNLNRLQIEGSLDIAKMEKRIELRRQARAARRQLWAGSDIDIEVEPKPKNDRKIDITGIKDGIQPVQLQIIEENEPNDPR